MASYYTVGADPNRERTSVGVKEDANYWYSYTQRGAVTRTPKGSAEQYYWFLIHEVLYGEKGQNTMYSTAFPHGAGYSNVSDKIPTRQTPETNYEKERGLGATNIFAIAHSELPDRVKGQWTKSGSHGLIVGALGDYINKKIEAKRIKDLSEAQAEENRIIMETALAKKKLMNHGGMILLRVI